MSKENNLKEFLTDVADAIREKKGTTDLISPLDFSKEILDMEAGSSELISRDVNFYDYDGTLLHSYTWEQIERMTELPPLPTREGLTCQEWNYTLDDIKAQSSHHADVGATYITSDGKTRMSITITSFVNTGVTMYAAISGTITIDWGDGTNGTINNGNTYHTYPSEGNYTISIDTSEGQIYFGYIPSSDSTSTSYNYVILRDYYNTPVEISKIEVGANTHFRFNAFYYNLGDYNHSFDVINIPVGSSFISRGTLQGLKLKGIVIPRGVTTIRQNDFSTYCEVISIPNTVQQIATSSVQWIERVCVPESVQTTNSFWSGSALKEIYLPLHMEAPKMVLYNAENITEDFLDDFMENHINEIVPSNFLGRSRKITEISIPQSVKKIDGSAFYDNQYCLEKVTLPEGIEEIGSYAFYTCRRLTEINLPNSIKVLGGSVFYNCNLKKIELPDDVETLWADLFYYNYTLRYVKFPKNLKRLKADSTRQSGSKCIFDFSQCVTIPYTASIPGISYSNAPTYVNEPLLEKWKTATNWSTIASYLTSRYSSIVVKSLISQDSTTINVSWAVDTVSVRMAAEVNAYDNLLKATRDVVFEWYEDISIGINESEEPVVKTFPVTYKDHTIQIQVNQSERTEALLKYSVRGAWTRADYYNPDTESYIGYYSSSMNGAVNTSTNMYIDFTVEGDETSAATFDFYIRSNGESGYDYIKVSNLDQTIDYNTSDDIILANTKNKATSSTDISSHEHVTLTVPSGTHTLTILYRKDSSGDQGDDCGYVLIPKKYRTI